MFLLPQDTCSMFHTWSCHIEKVVCRSHYALSSKHDFDEGKAGKSVDTTSFAHVFAYPPRSENPISYLSQRAIVTCRLVHHGHERWTRSTSFIASKSAATHS